MIDNHKNISFGLNRLKSVRDKKSVKICSICVPDTYRDCVQKSLFSKHAKIPNTFLTFEPIANGR